MNWYKPLVTDTVVTDNFIGTSIYPGVSTQGEGIDLRQEMSWMLYGKNTYPQRQPKGHWVVYRRFDRTEKSSYYSERTHEGVGGPSHIYTDEILRTRRVPTDKTALTLERTKLGSDITDKYIYFLEYTVVPKRGDVIIELVWPDHQIKPTVNTTTYAEKYTIERVHGYRLEGGNIQYYIVSAQFDEVSY